MHEVINLVKDKSEQNKKKVGSSTDDYLSSVLEEYITAKNEIKVTDLDSNPLDWEEKSDNYNRLLDEFTDIRTKQLEDVLKKCGLRRKDIEDRVFEDYNPRFEEIFSNFGIDVSYIPAYQMQNLRGEEFIFSEESCSGIYLQALQTASFKKRVVDEHMIRGLVHETVHHNLKKFRESKCLWNRDKYVEEGLTEFLTWRIMNESQKEYSERINQKYPGYLPREKREFDAPYVLGRQYFELIFNKLGFDGVVEAYRQSSDIIELNEFMYLNNIDIFNSLSTTKN